MKCLTLKGLLSCARSTNATASSSLVHLCMFAVALVAHRTQSRSCECYIFISNRSVPHHGFHLYTSFIYYKTCSYMRLYIGRYAATVDEPPPFVFQFMMLADCLGLPPISAKPSF